MPGQGKPLDLRLNPFDGDRAMAFRVLRQAGEALPWIALGREIAAEEQAMVERLARTAARLRAMAPAERPAAREPDRRRYLERATGLDRKLVEHDAMIPLRSFDRGRVTPAAAATRFDAAC